MRWLAWLSFTALAACTEPLETGPLPPDPPVAACPTAQLTPITSVHEHISTAQRLDLIKAHMHAIDVERIVLLPFFEEHAEQNGAQLKAALADEHILSFATVDPHDLDASRKIIAHIEAGGAGVKLFSGHRMYHLPTSIVSPNAWLVYQTIESLGVPLIMHVNGELYEDELRAVLEAFPKLRISCPHYCLFVRKSHRLHALLDQYPNLYTDVSFGSAHIAVSGAVNVSAHRDELRRVVRHHADRILFGTDLPNGEDPGTKATADTLVRMYRDMLEKDEYSLLGQTHRGLNLDPCTLEKIYRTNADAFLARDHSMQAGAPAP